MFWEFCSESFVRGVCPGSFVRVVLSEEFCPERFGRGVLFGDIFVRTVLFEEFFRGVFHAITSNAYCKSMNLGSILIYTSKFYTS